MNSLGFVSFTARGVGESVKDLQMCDYQMVVYDRAEIHWYEASGIGKIEFKIKRFVD